MSLCIFRCRSRADVGTYWHRVSQVGSCYGDFSGYNGEKVEQFLDFFANTLFKRRYL